MIISATIGSCKRLHSSVGESHVLQCSGVSFSNAIEAANWSCGSRPSFRAACCSKSSSATSLPPWRRVHSKQAFAASLFPFSKATFSIASVMVLSETGIARYSFRSSSLEAGCSVANWVSLVIGFTMVSGNLSELSCPGIWGYGDPTINPPWN